MNAITNFNLKGHVIDFRAHVMSGEETIVSDEPTPTIPIIKTEDVDANVVTSSHPDAGGDSVGVALPTNASNNISSIECNFSVPLPSSPVHLGQNSPVGILGMILFYYHFALNL